MTKPVTLSRKELARYRCNDCGVNVVTAGDFYMLQPKIWEDQLRTRLGRQSLASAVLSND